MCVYGHVYEIKTCLSTNFAETKVYDFMYYSYSQCLAKDQRRIFQFPVFRSAIKKICNVYLLNCYAFKSNTNKGLGIGQ